MHVPCGKVRWKLSGGLIGSMFLTVCHEDSLKFYGLCLECFLPSMSMILSKMSSRRTRFTKIMVAFLSKA